MAVDNAKKLKKHSAEKKEKKELKERKRQREEEEPDEIPGAWEDAFVQAALFGAEVPPEEPELQEEELTLPPEEAPSEDEGAGSFWDALEGLAVEAPRRASVAAAAAQSAGAAAPPRVQSGASVLQVPPARVEDLSKRLPQLESASGAKLELSGTVLRVSGGTVERARGERYAHAIIAQHAAEDEHSDHCAVSVLAEWAQRYRGQESRLEGSGSTALVVLEAPPSQLTSRYVPGQAIEARWGEHGVGNDATAVVSWHMAIVLGRPGSSRVRVRWCFDGSTDEVELAKTRPAWRVVIFGAQRKARLAVELRVMVSFEEFAKGTIAARMEAQKPCNGLGLSYVELNIRYGTFNRLNNREVPKHLLVATGCLAVEFFMFPKWSAMAERADKPCALFAGLREQRWQASEMLVAYAAGLDGKELTFLPPHLAGECRVVSIPKDMLSGPARVHLIKLMEATQAFVVQVSERRGRPGKQDVDETGDMLEMMLEQLRRGPTCEVAVFGEPRRQLSAELKMLSMVEERYHGYFQSSPEAEAPSPYEGLAVERAWLARDFEDSASRTRVDVLAGASGGVVESAGPLVFIGGTRAQRGLAREYLGFMAAGRTAPVPNLGARRDALHLKVPAEVVKSSWLSDQLQQLSLETKTVALYDGWRGQLGWGRLVVLGAVLAQPAAAPLAVTAAAGAAPAATAPSEQGGEGNCRAEVFERAKGLVEKAFTWAKWGYELTGQWWELASTKESAVVDRKTAEEQRRESAKAAEEAAVAPEPQADVDVPAADVPEVKKEETQEDSKEPKRPKEADEAEEGAERAEPEADAAVKKRKKMPEQVKEVPQYSKEVLQAAPQTPPVGSALGKIGAAAPCTPGLIGSAAPCTPAMPAGGGVPMPCTPARPPAAAAAPASPVEAAKEGGSGTPQGFRGVRPPEQALVAEAPVAKRFRGAAPPSAALVSGSKKKLASVSKATPAAVPAQPAVGGADVPAGAVAAPQTPAPGGGGNSVPAPCTPAPKAAGIPMPQTPAPPKVGGVPAPCTPAPPRAEGASGAVPAPRTPAPGQQTSGIPAPCTPAPQQPSIPAAGPPQPCTPATAKSTSSGVAAPRTPARTMTPPPAAARVAAAAAASGPVSAPCTPASGNVAAPCTPAVGGGGGVGVAMPRTPSSGSAAPPPAARVAVAEPEPSGAAAAPQTPISSARSNPLRRPPASARVQEELEPEAAEPPPPLPDLGDIGGSLPSSAAPVPSTPAAIRSVASSSAPPVPSTPAAIARAPASSARAAPQTPAAIASRATAIAPQTPAFITGAARASTAPQTPAFTSGRGAPQTPSGGKARGAPGTPGTISGGTRPVPNTPSALGNADPWSHLMPSTPATILSSGPPSPTAAPPSRAPVAPKKAAPKKPPPTSKFAPRKPQQGAEEVQEEEVEAPAVPLLHHGMNYSEWVAAKLSGAT